MVKGPKRFVKSDGMNHYKVDINNAECIIYFWSDAPTKITKVLLKLWFKKFRNSGCYVMMEDFFEECGYRLKCSNDEVERYIPLRLEEVIL